MFHDSRARTAIEVTGCHRLARPGLWDRSNSRNRLNVRNVARGSDLVADYFSFLVVSFLSASIVTSTCAPSLIATSSPFLSFKVLSMRISR
jgi:hypothetical protein